MRAQNRQPFVKRAQFSIQALRHREVNGIRRAKVQVEPA
jgi:hypothetical protein